MWIISKQFDFEYGHRVWTQTLNEEYSCDGACTCRGLHGHSGRVIVSLYSDTLQNNMVTDFKHLNWFKKFLDDNLDHKFLIDEHDPALPLLLSWMQTDIKLSEPDPLSSIRTVVYTSPQLPSLFAAEVLNSFAVLPFCPTSENLTKWFFEIVDSKMSKLGVMVQGVQLFETAKSQANYIAVPKVLRPFNYLTNEKEEK